jgi:hypothetical protein
MERHIFSQHGLSGEPIDSVTGLTRLQSQSMARRSYDKSYFHNWAKSRYQPGPWPSTYHRSNDNENDSNKSFWEMADKFKDLKELELIREIQGNVATIVHQNNQIIALLGSIFDTMRG